MVTINPIWKKNRNNYAKILLAMLKASKIDEPFNRLPPDGPLQKIKPQNPLKEPNFNAKTLKPTENQPNAVEYLQKELQKSKEREECLKEELMVIKTQLSAKLIHEQDRIIENLRKQLNSEYTADLDYLEVLKNETDMLAWSSELLVSPDTFDSPSMEDISIE